MKSYNSKDWFSVVFVYRQDTLRVLWPLMAVLGGYTLLVDYWLDLRPQLLENALFKHLGIVHSLLGLVISLLLVFRTNTAYDRWWEGRKLWGALVNNSRNLALRLNAMLPTEDSENRNFFASFIAVYAKTLDLHLKSAALVFQLDENEHPELAELRADAHGPNQIASRLHERIYSLSRNGVISSEEMLSLSPEIAALTDICGACERIKNTPIPYSYATFIKKFIVIYVISLPWSLAANLGYWSVLVVLFIMYAFASLEVIAEEIEEPFGLDPNDLPTGKLALNIGSNVREILQPDLNR